MHSPFLYLGHITKWVLATKILPFYDNGEKIGSETAKLCTESSKVEQSYIIPDQVSVLDIC